jgi:hypothetical protein
MEGTVTQGVRMGNLRRSRSIGVVKTPLMHLLLTAAHNFLRVASWLATIPRTQAQPL